MLFLDKLLFHECLFCICLWYKYPSYIITKWLDLLKISLQDINHSYYRITESIILIKLDEQIHILWLEIGIKIVTIKLLFDCL